MPAPAPAQRLLAVLCPAALALVAVLLLSGVAGTAALAVDDLTQLAAALGATVACAATARRTTGRQRWAWTCMAVGCGGWTSGQAVWSWYELALGVETPFPSPGDVGFLTFPVAAAVALLVHPAPSAVPGDQSRRLLDGVLVTASLLLLSWSTALGAVVADASDALSTVVATAYPAGDVVVLTMVVVLLSRATGDRRPLALLGAGVATIAVADSAFLYLTSVGHYDSDLHLVGLGWATGFLLVGLGAGAAGRTGATAEGPGGPAGRLRLLPYAPVVLALALTVGRTVAGQPVDRVEAVVGTAVIGLVLVRQYALVRDHARLLDALALREAELRHQAFHDGLTGLVNRALFRERVGLALQQRGRPVTVLFCDLDDFKLVNDGLGHATGDALLVRVAERLSGVLRADDTLARLGGDEFAVLLGHSDDPLAVAVRMVRSLHAPLVLEGTTVAARMSVGATTVPAGSEPAPDVDTVLAQADTAMYAAKRDGGGAVRLWTSGMALAEVAEADRARALAAAVSRREVTLVYQPVVDVGTGRTEGVEALARWSHDGQPVPPDVFVALAERTGLIGPLTELVLDTACAQAAAWAQAGLQPSLRVGVNLSPSSIVDPSLPDVVARTLARHGVPGTGLVLEITESGVLQDPEVARRVCLALQRQGVKLALDDFGVGYASLAHLNDLPLDIVKLDRSLLTGVGTDPDRTGFVSAVLRLGLELGLSVVAEGVEEPAQLAALRTMGMPMAQGYLLSRPLTADVVTPLLGQRLAGPVTSFA